MYGATMVFMEQSNKSRNVKYYMTKMGWVICRVCEGFTILMIMCQLFLPLTIWREIIIDTLMAFNICFLIAIMVEKLFPTLIMNKISAFLTDLKFKDSIFGILLVYIPVIIAISANIYAFW